MNSYPHQHFCSYLFSWGFPESLTERMLRRLPAVRTDGLQYKFGNGNLFLFPPTDNPLHKWYLGAQKGCLVFVQGEFYDDSSLEKLMQGIGSGGLQESRLATEVAGLNGVFSGFAVDTRRGIGVHFCDRFGFGGQYILRGTKRWACASSLWPLITAEKGSAAWNAEAITDVLLFGYPLFDETLWSDIKVVMGGSITRSDNQSTGTTQYTMRVASERRKKKWSIIKEEFAQAFSGHFEYIGKIVPKDRFGIALSGGHDSRVVLNAMLANSIQPSCYIGYSGRLTADVKRAKLVVKFANCTTRIVDCATAEAQVTTDVNVLLDGMRSGMWTMNLARSALKQVGCLYFGTTGDVLSGGWHVEPTRFKDVDGLALAVLEANYEYSTPIADFFGIFDKYFLQEMAERFKRTFECCGRDLREMYIAQRLRVRNARRIRAFMQGAYLYGNPVHLFHDKRIAHVYDTLLFDRLHYQKVHNRLLCQERILHGIIPASNLPTPPILEPLLKPLFNNLPIRRLRTLHARTQRERIQRPVARTRDIDRINDIGSTIGLNVNRLGEVLARDRRGDLLAARLGSVLDVLDPASLEDKTRLFGRKKLASKDIPERVG